QVLTQKICAGLAMCQRDKNDDKPARWVDQQGMQQIMVQIRFITGN
ncbi:MAG: hypothetical protein ACI8R4_003878, partial [Paracoccaceae bacterium]